MLSVRGWSRDTRFQVTSVDGDHFRDHFSKQGSMDVAISLAKATPPRQRCQVLSTMRICECPKKCRLPFCLTNPSRSHVPK